MWKIKSTIIIDFISPKDGNGQERIMHSKSNDKEIMSNEKADEVVEELFESTLNIYQNDLEKLMKGGEFVFQYIHLL